MHAKGKKARENQGYNEQWPVFMFLSDLTPLQNRGYLQSDNTPFHAMVTQRRLPAGKHIDAIINLFPH